VIHFEDFWGGLARGALEEEAGWIPGRDRRADLLQRLAFMASA